MNASARNFGLDAMRALAILLVIASHMKRQLIVTGHLAVELFFVLSGFLIGGIFLREIVESRTTDFGGTVRFWKRRWWRTLPNYLLFLVIYLVVDLISGKGVLSLVGRYLVFLQNFAWPIGPFYVVSWSLAIEEWFYFSMPIVYWLASRVIGPGRNAFFVTVALIVVVSTASRFVLGAHLPYDVVRQTVLYRLDAMMVGVLCAALARRRPETWAKAWALWPVGLAGIMGLVYVNRDHYSTHLALSPALSYTLFPPFVALLLPALSAWKTAHEGWRRPVEFFALTSYAAYLGHPLVLWAIDTIPGAEQSGSLKQLCIKLLAFPLILVGAYLIYRFFESPMTRRRDTGGLKNEDPTVST